MPPARSARSVYNKRISPEKVRGRPRKSSTSPGKVESMSASNEIVKKGRGRPRKYPISPVKAKSSIQKSRKRESSVNLNNSAEIIENHSSEADLSSEGEETDQSNDESPDESMVSSEEKEESSGEESDLEEDNEEEEVIYYKKRDNEDTTFSETDNIRKGKVLINDSKKLKSQNKVTKTLKQVDGSDEEEVASADEIQEEQSDSEADVCYSFPEPNNLFETTNGEEDTNTEDENSNKKNNSEEINQIQLKQSPIKDKIAQKMLNSSKRKIIQEIDEAEEGESSEVIFRKPKKKRRKKLARANVTVEDSTRNFNASESSRLLSFSPRQNFNLNGASTPSFPSSTMSPHPHLDSIHSLIRLNKSVPCGNIAADQAFRWLIGPTLPVDFYHNKFEKLPFTVIRENSLYYKDLFSVNDINTMLKEHNLEYKVHIDVVKYVKGLRIPLEAEGRAYNSNVWEDYKQGYSLRVRNPQTYNKNLWKLCSLLQEYFSSTVGCNIYLTPPKAQGFPPHYDDIDAFIVQVEGRKYWKVYSPRLPEEELARYSSKDFCQNEIGTPILQVCLNAGDMLYIPRGYIHQAATDNIGHSLHLTFSTNQLNTWGDLLMIAAGRAVEKAMLSDVTFRESIPKDYMDYLGSSVADSKAFTRYELINKVKELAKRAMSYIDVDEATDLHSLKFLEASLPPVLNKIEKEHSLHGNGSFWRNGDIRLKGNIMPDTEVQLIKKRNLRLVIGDSNPRLYHTYENMRDPKPVSEEEPLAAYVELEMEVVPAYLFLLNSYPDFIKVKDIPLVDPDDKIDFATSLYENGLIMTKEPLPLTSEKNFDRKSISDLISPFKEEHSC